MSLPLRWESKLKRSKWIVHNNTLQFPVCALACDTDGERERCNVTQPATWNIVLLQKLIVIQVVKKFMEIMEPEGSLPWSQETTSGTYCEPSESTLSRPNYLTDILILASKLCSCLWNGIFSSGFPNKILYAFLISMFWKQDVSYWNAKVVIQ
jgi:hypothetical protein